MTETSNDERPAGMSTASDRANDVHLKYLEARRHEHTFQAMTLARQVAEAVAAALDAEVPEADRRGYLAKDLGARLGFLDEKTKKGELQVPRAIIAALQTLRAYGNYASHYEPGTHQPYRRATASAMASLALVAQWFLYRDPDRPTEIRPDVSLREPAPEQPGFFERRRLLGSVELQLAELEVNAMPRSKFIVWTSDGAAVQLGALYSYYGHVATVCASVCRCVVARETTIDPSAMDLDQLALFFAQVSEARPTRVPRSVCAAVEEVERRIASVRKAMDESKPDTAALILQGRQPSPALELTLWFRRDYLGQGWLERRWFVAIVVVLASYAVLWLSYQFGESDGDRDGQGRLRASLIQEFCENEPTADAGSLCDRLRRPRVGQGSLSASASAAASVPTVPPSSR